ncbi:hypothetical protein FHS78_000664 [Parvibaculum indicum]|uniref:hypothetical protein n=1 Tax=Parvibaculum indicum TaxID=562969 RepID=UPI001420787E|nr:hypothetical protein [Parvibaculum indicum]NIJ40394.1 hypothetical protein [Parvibaculum indicum]
MSAQERIDEFRKAFRELAEAEAQIIEAMKPFNAALSAIHTAVETLREEAELTGHLGSCLECNDPLLPGDPGHVCRDGEWLCEQCAFTYAELKGQAETMLADKDSSDEDREHAGAMMARVERHLADGGKLEDRAVGTL